MPNVRKTAALAIVGALDALDQWAVEPARIRAADLAVHEALLALGRRFVIGNKHAPQCPLLARCRLGALVIAPESGLPLGALRIINEYFGFDREWLPTTEGADYLPQGFSERALRGLAAPLAGSTVRPDQVGVEFRAVTEAELRKHKEIAEESLIIPPAGWDARTAARLKKKFVDAQFPAAPARARSGKRKGGR